MEIYGYSDKETLQGKVDSDGNQLSYAYLYSYEYPSEKLEYINSYGLKG